MTKYRYDTLGRLVETEQGAQFRKFKYDSLGRLTRQKLAEQTATLNDAGTFVGVGGSGAAWSEAFVYDNRSNLTQKTDARGVRTNFSFQLSGGGQDPLNRIHARSYDTSGPLQPGLPIHNVWGTTVSYEYMTTGDKSRIKKIVTQGLLTEDYTYDGQSRVNEYKQTVDYRASYAMSTSYVYDSLDRVKEVHYPAQYGLSGSPRKIVAHSYDTASRLTQMTYGGAVQASDMVFNAADQTTSIKIGEVGTNQITEEYTFDQQTGLLTNQTAKKNGTTTLLNLSYEYNRLGSAGNLNGKTGHLTKIIDNLDNAKNREYEFDAVGRLTKAKGGATGTLWDQNYSYDRYGNRTNVVANGVAADSSPIPLDGLPNLAYDATSNRITTTGFEYDVAGNQIKAPGADGNGLIFEYDAANRISVIKKESDGSSVQGFQYGSTNARLMDHDSVNNQLKIFASTGGTTLAEYTEFSHTVPTWTKSYTYLGSTQLATITPNGTGGEYVEFNHPDRLGTRVITNQQTGSSSEQAHLPFGTALNAESSLMNNNKRFTSYDRSAQTGLDYAVNRTYDSKQGRFTQVDPIGMQAASLASPQTLNMYTYCGNDPVNYVDPSGLFFGKLFKWLWKAIRIIAAVVFAVLAVLAFSIGWIPAGIVLAVASAGLIAELTHNAFLHKLVRFASIALSAYRIYNLPPALTPGTFPTSFASNCPPNCAGTIRLPGETVTVSMIGPWLRVLQGILQSPIVQWLLRQGHRLWNWVTRTASWIWEGLKSAGRYVWEGVKGAGRWAKNTAKDAWRWITDSKVEDNRLHHIFGKASHNLDDLVEQFGSQEKAFQAVQNAADAALRNGTLTPNAQGILPKVGSIINVGGTQVQLIGGRVVDGRVVISSFSRQGL